VKVRAKDANGTILTARPQVFPKPEAEEQEKKTKKKRSKRKSRKR